MFNVVLCSGNQSAQPQTVTSVKSLLHSAVQCTVQCTIQHTEYSSVQCIFVQFSLKVCEVSINSLGGN